MGSDIAVRKSVLAEIVARAESTTEEVCGLLLGEPDRIVAIVPCDNVAADPITTFEIDPGQLIAAYRTQRAGGPAIVGCYHSHPGGAATPSLRDAADAQPNGWLWLIVSGQEITLHRAVADGRHQRRFDPVAIVRV